MSAPGGRDVLVAARSSFDLTLAGENFASMSDVPGAHHRCNLRVGMGLGRGFKLGRRPRQRAFPIINDGLIGGLATATVLIQERS